MRASTSIETSRSSYHHGDLRAALLAAARDMIAEAGIEGLSLRKLAERAGVSRTAPYHHFQDKNDLLCAIAAEGFQRRHREAIASFNDLSMTQREKFEAYICDYIRFAVESPEQYELMFGRSIWKQKNSTQELRDVAYPCFQHSVDMIRCWQECGLLSKDDNPLRTSQVIWGAVHGIAKLWIDGIYTDDGQIEAVALCAVNIFINKAP